jgi:apolipoprotein D and lipocalin family protein
MVAAFRRSALILLLACVAGAASAASPRPAASVPLRLYSGRWYEIARTPNLRERGCKLPTSDFSGMANGVFEVIETCPRASGPPRVSKVRAALIPGSNNAKFRMSLLGGLIHPQFWILDTAPGGDWAIMGTSGGHYVWVLSRRPTLPSGEKAAIVAKVAALGYPTAKLVYD